MLRLRREDGVSADERPLSAVLDAAIFAGEVESQITDDEARRLRQWCTDRGIEQGDG
jgi:hypothetical protein